jgi:hypothetical protein
MRVKALRSLHGSYGSLAEGQETVIKDSLAKELIEAGLVEQVSEEQPVDKDPEPAKSSIKVTGGNKGKVKE